MVDCSSVPALGAAEARRVSDREPGLRVFGRSALGVWLAATAVCGGVWSRGPCGSEPVRPFPCNNTSGRFSVLGFYQFWRLLVLLFSVHVFLDVIDIELHDEILFAAFFFLNG